MPRFKTFKQRGEWVELKFMAEAAERGFNIAKPYGDSARYDVALERDGRFIRVQVKSTARRTKRGTGYTAASCRTGQHPYTARDFDFLAVYLIPRKTWYVIPVAAIRGRNSIGVGNKSKRPAYCVFEEYREAWHQLSAAFPKHKTRQRKCRMQKSECRMKSKSKSKSKDFNHRGHEGNANVRRTAVPQGRLTVAQRFSAGYVRT